MKIFPRPGAKKRQPGSNGRADQPTSGPNGTRPRPPGPESPRLRGAPGPAGTGGDQGQRPFWNLMSRRWLWILGGLLIANLVATSFFSNEPTQNRNQVSYSFFKEQVETGNVADVTARGDILQGTFKRSVAPPKDPNSTSTREPRSSELFQTQLPAWVLQTNALETLLEQNNVTIAARPLDTGRQWWLSILISFGPGLLFFGLLFWMSAR